MCVISCIIFQDNRQLSLGIREVLGYILPMPVSKTTLVRVCAKRLAVQYVTPEVFLSARPSRGGLPDLHPSRSALSDSPPGSSPLRVPVAGGSAGRCWSYRFPACSIASLCGSPVVLPGVPRSGTDTQPVPPQGSSLASCVQEGPGPSRGL